MSFQGPAHSLITAMGVDQDDDEDDWEDESEQHPGEEEKMSKHGRTIFVPFAHKTMSQRALSGDGCPHYSLLGCFYWDTDT